MMAKPPNVPDQERRADPVSHLMSGIEPLVRAATRSRRRSGMKRRDRVITGVVIALVVLLVALSLISIGLMLGGK